MDGLERVAGEVAEILKFQELNITAVRKILKKFNKGFEILHNQQAMVFLSRVLSPVDNKITGSPESEDLGYGPEIAQAYATLLTDDVCKRVINLIESCCTEL